MNSRTASDLGYLAALQIADSFFPTGMYAHSHGLESLVRRGTVRSMEDVESFLQHLLEWSVLTSDGVALLAARDAAEAGRVDELVSIDRHLFALKLSAELRSASVQQGRRLLDEASALVRHDVLGEYTALVRTKATPGNGAVAFGVVSSSLGVSREASLLGYSHAFCVGVLGAAMRLLPMTHGQCQGILHRIHPRISAVATDIDRVHWSDMTSFAPEIEIGSLNHPFDDVRMFAS